MTQNRNGQYWSNRFIKIEDALNGYGQDTYRQIEPAFDKAQREIQSAIDSWVVRVANNNQVSITEAKRMLDAKELAEFRWNVKEYIKYGYDNALDAAWMKELENASARYHISRLETLKIKTQQAMEKAFGNELDELDSMVKRVYSEGYYHSIYELQKGFEIGWDIASIDSQKLEKLISKPWAADGKNFSKRIWQSKTTMVNELHNELVRTCILGKAPDEAIGHMTKFVDKKFKNAKMQAGRLVMTEQAFFASAAQKDCFNELDVEEFEVVATLDSHTSTICQAMDGQHFTMKDYQPGVTAPPFHVWCRSTTVPYFDDEFNFGERAARGEDGKIYYVPDSMKYPEWKVRYVQDSISPADFEQYNRYKKILGKDKIDSVEDFLQIKYNDRSKWEDLKFQIITRNKLQCQLYYIYKGEKMFVPTNTRFSSTPKTIAGKGSETPIRDVKRLVAEYGGAEKEWAKKVAKVESESYVFDIHWYEKDGIQYETKLKQRKERGK